jgi:hypothetical protein
VTRPKNEGSSLPFGDEALRLARASLADGAGRGPSRRMLWALGVGSFLMVAPYARARATRQPLQDPTPTPNDDQPS